MADISKITLPSGNVYDIKDATARSAIANINNWSYIVCTNAANTPKDITWDDGGTTITGTLVASTDTMYKIYLVPDTNGDNDIYDEYITVNPSGSTYSWEKFGDTSVNIDDLGDFAYVDTGTVSVQPKGTNASSSVTFAQHTTAKVLTSSTTATVPKTASSTKYLNVETSKLATTSIKGVSSSTLTASYATAGTAVDVATTDTATDVASGALGTETSTRTADTPMWGATVENEVLSFTFKPLSTKSIVPAKSNGTITPHTFSDVTVPVADTNPTTVATGSLSTNASGASVATGIGTSSSSSGASGEVTYVESVSESGTNNVTFSSNTTADAITELGAATAAAQTFTGTTESFTVYPVTPNP